MSTIYGYCRVSTSKQSTQRQEVNIKRAYPTAEIITEKYTGTKVQGRREFEKLLKKVKSDDTIVFDSVSRMSRNAKEGFQTYLNLYNQGVHLIFLKESTINTAVFKSILGDGKLDITVATGDSDTDEFVNGLLSEVTKYITKLAEKQIAEAFNQAQKEVDDLHDRIAEGIRESDKQVGRPAGKTYQTSKSLKVKELIIKHCKTFGNGTLSDVDTLALINGTTDLHCSRNSYYKYKGELISEMNSEQSK